MDIYLVILGIVIGFFFAHKWKNDDSIEWSQYMELFVGGSVAVLVGWLLYNRKYNIQNDICNKIIIIFLSINASFHLTLFHPKFRKT